VQCEKLYLTSNCLPLYSILQCKCILLNLHLNIVVSKTEGTYDFTYQSVRVMIYKTVHIKLKTYKNTNRTKNRGGFGCSGRVNSSCSASGPRCVIVNTHERRVKSPGCINKYKQQIKKMGVETKRTLFFAEVVAKLNIWGHVIERNVLLQLRAEGHTNGIKCFGRQDPGKTWSILN